MGYNFEVILPVTAYLFIETKQHKNMNNKLFNMAQASERDNRIEAGYFDGRFAPKQFVDRKKEANRKECRTYRYSND
jgi:hypothetical protein